MSRRSRILGYGSAALLVLAGIAGAISVSGTVGQVLALMLIGLGCVLATGLVFLEVGLSEDREREREAAQSAAGTAREQSAGGSGHVQSAGASRHDQSAAASLHVQSAAASRPRERPRRRGLERMRGSRRRLR